MSAKLAPRRSTTPIQHARRHMYAALSGVAADLLHEISEHMKRKMEEVGA